MKRLLNYERTGDEERERGRKWPINTETSIACISFFLVSHIYKVYKESYLAVFEQLDGYEWMEANTIIFLMFQASVWANTYPLLYPRKILGQKEALIINFRSNKEI